MLPLKVFIVDDDMDEIVLLNEAFKNKSEEIELSFFQNPEGVVPYLDANFHHSLPDIIISDLNMPKLSGLELLKGLKSSEKFNHIPVFICSSSTLSKDKEQCLSAGAHDFIIKPLKLSQYSTVVETIIKHFVDVR